MVGVPLEKVIGSDIGSYLAAGAWQELQKVFQAKDAVIKHESVIRNESKKEVTVNLTASQLPMESQNVMCLVVTDLTLLRAQEDLRMGKELAEKANLAKDSFLARLSHELRTPLTPALLTVADLEQNASLSDEVRHDLAMIRRNIELEARLIDDLLDVTRIVRGKLELRTEPLDVHHVLNQAIEICRPELEVKHLHLRLHLEAARHQVHGEPVRLQQVFWNLVRNAIKFTPHGGLVTVRTGNSPQGKLWVDVVDTGIGFAPDEGPRLFEAFEQANRQITQHYGGLGLGLAISRSVVEAHQGVIRAESAGPGQGAKFTLELPLFESGETQVHVEPSAAPPAPSSASAHILLVEDHGDTRQNLEFLLQRRHHHVRQASSAEEAIRAASQESFDMVISDVGLPDMSGLDLMRILRDRFGLRGIAVSGFGMDEDLQQSLKAGFIHHLTKPVKMDRLLQAIADLKGSATAP
jgi:signal transduction histidine kinase